jgi:hypothetical protein
LFADLLNSISFHSIHRPYDCDAADDVLISGNRSRNATGSLSRILTAYPSFFTSVILARSRLLVLGEKTVDRIRSCDRMMDRVSPSGSIASMARAEDPSVSGLTIPVPEKVRVSCGLSQVSTVTQAASPYFRKR